MTSKRKILYLDNDATVPRMVASRRVHAIDDHAFSEMTPDAAYWVGFLMADGGITRRQGFSAEIRVSLKEGDLAHVEAFRAFVGSTHTIVRYPKTKAWAVSVSSNQIADDLEKYGVTPQKSFTAQVKCGLALDRNFWRGVIDGNGSLYPNNPTHVNLCGSETLMSQFVEFVREVCPGAIAQVKHYVYAGNPNGQFRVDVAGSDSRKLVAYLYQPGDMALARKREAAMVLIARQPRAWVRRTK